VKGADYEACEDWRFPHFRRISQLLAPAANGPHFLSCKVAPLYCKEPRDLIESGFMDARGKVFYGSVVNPIDIHTLDVLTNALLAVSTDGSIAWLERHVERQQIPTVLMHHCWETAQLITLSQGDWLMPGFIDTHTVCSSILMMYFKLYVFDTKHAPQFPNIGMYVLFFIFIIIIAYFRLAQRTGI
jgi:hypothetical protein